MTEGKTVFLRYIVFRKTSPRKQSIVFTKIKLRQRDILWSKLQLELAVGLHMEELCCTHIS